MGPGGGRPPVSSRAPSLIDEGARRKGGGKEEEEGPHPLYPRKPPASLTRRKTRRGPVGWESPASWRRTGWEGDQEEEEATIPYPSVTRILNFGPNTNIFEWKISQNTNIEYICSQQIGRIRISNIFVLSKWSNTNIEYIHSLEIGRIRISNIFVTRKLSIRIRISNIWCKIFEYIRVTLWSLAIWRNESNIIIELAKKE